MDLSGIAVLVVAAALAYFFIFKGKKEQPAPPPAKPPVIPSPTLTPLRNLPPEVFPPFLVGDADWRGQIIIDLRHRIHGCDSSGLPVDETGSFDPDGDLLEYFIAVTGPDKDGNQVFYSVFDRVGQPMDTQWLPREYFPVVRKNRFDVNDPTAEQQALGYCIIGHTEDEPPTGTIIGAKCGPRPPAPDSTPTAPVLGEMTVVYKARDPSGKMRSAAITVPVTMASCGGG